MSTRPCIAIGLGLLLAGCQRAQAPVAPMTIPGIGQGDGQAEWSGTLPCADCAGIETQLVLRRQGPDLRYRMIEIYVSDDSNARFVEQGKWAQENAGLLRMRGESGAQHVFALVADGRLQPRDNAGKPFFGRDADLLSPLRAGPAAP